MPPPAPPAPRSTDRISQVFRVPAGAQVLLGATVGNHLPEYFPEPYRFGIDRYSRDRAEHLQPGAFAPFGVDRHRFIGSSLAELQITFSPGPPSFTKPTLTTRSDSAWCVAGPGQPDPAMKQNPEALLDPATAQALRRNLADTGGLDAPAADALLNSLHLALTGALSNVFTVLWTAVALSFFVALFLRVRADTGQVEAPCRR